MKILMFAKKIIRDKYELKENTSILIVTNEYHLFRSKLLARRLGFMPFGKAALTPTYPVYLAPFQYIREYFGVIKSLIFDWE